MIFETKPFAHQIEAYNKVMNWFKEHNYYALFMDMGTGKTKVSIDIASNLFSEGKLEAVLLIAPNGVQEQWYSQEILKHTPVITTELLWRNSTANYWMDKVYDFVGPEKETIEFHIAKKKQEQEKIKETLDQEQYEKDIQKINDLFEDIAEPEFKQEVIYNKIIIAEPEKQSKWEKQTDCLKWLCVNVDRFSRGDGKTFQPFIDYLKNHKTLIIIDEATIIKNPNANRTKILYKLGNLAAYKLILTGTPVTNSPFDVWSMLEFCKPYFWKCNYFIFKHRYGIQVKDTNVRTKGTFTRLIRPHEFEMIRAYHSEGKTIDEICIILNISEKNVRWIIEHPETNRPYKRLSELKTAIQPCSYTIKKDDCLDIPPKIYTTILLDMTKEQEKVYNDLKKKMLAEYAGKELTVQNKVSLILRLQQISGGFFPYRDEEYNAASEQIGKANPKIEKLKQEIHESGDLKIIVWSRFVAEIILILESLRKEFPYKIIEAYYGGTNSVERNKIKTDFQNGQVDVLIINQQAGSRGLNLQRSTLHYFYSNNYSLEHRNQAEDRSHRYGQTKNVQYKDLVMKNTVDEQVLISLRKHKEVLDYFRSKSLEELI